MIMTGSFNSPMGYGGACGTALWDHRTKSWDPELLNLALEREGDGAAVLESMLTPIVAPGTALPISNFFSDMSGISTFARVYEPTGDNPGTRVTIKDREDGTPSTVISLGTSITGNIGLAEEQVDTSGNLALMFDYVGRPFYLVCRTNGTARWDEARDISRSDYKGQDRILSQYLDGVIANAGTARPAEILFNYAKNETFPEIKIYQKRHGFDQGNPKNDLRATIESSLADIAVHAGEFIPEGPVEVAGGGSKSPEVVRMLAAMLNRPIVVSEGSSEGACLGSNYAAQFFYLNEIRTTETPLAQIVGTASAGTLVEPNAALVRYYHQDGGYLDQFRAAQAPLLNKS